MFTICGRSPEFLLHFLKNITIAMFCVAPFTVTPTDTRNRTHCLQRMWPQIDGPTGKFPPFTSATATDR